MIAYILTMPNVGSWNGVFTGAKNFYCLCRKYTDKKLEKKILDEKSFYYNFGDGWGARIEVQKINGAGKYRKMSKGFMGYDWMVNSIEKNLKIVNTKDTL